MSILPELLRRERETYLAALKEVSDSSKDKPKLRVVHALVSRLLQEQLNGSPIENKTALRVQLLH